MKISRFLGGDIQVGGSGVKIPIDGLVAKHRERYEKEAMADHVQYMVYRVNDRRFIHLKIPSMSMLRKGRKFYYDVVFEFVTIDESNLDNSDILLYCNSPGFGYNYCFALYHFGSQDEHHTLFNITKRNTPTNSQLVRELTSKYPPKMLNDPPTIRNPGELALADHVVYAALFYMMDNVPVSEILAGRYVSMNQIIMAVASFDRMAMERRRIENDLKRQKRKNNADLSKEFDVVEKDLERRSGIRSPSKPRRASSSSAPTAARTPRGPSKPKGF